MVKLEKIWYKDAYRIFVNFDYDSHLIEKVKSINATYSASRRSWYLNYSKESYNNIRRVLHGREICVVKP